MKKQFAYLLPLLLFSWNCKKENDCDCFKGTGEIVTEERQLPIFKSVLVENNINVIFLEDTFQRVSVEAGKHLIKLIKTEMNGDELHITNENTCNFMRRYDIPINVYIHYKRNQFYRLTYRGTGTMSNSNPCTNDSIDLQLQSSGDINFEMGYGTVFTHQHGAGDITLTGACGEVIIYSIGTGFTITDECTNGYTWLYTNTTGKITVDPSGLLISNIDGTGNVYYKGAPSTIQNSETSTGHLLPLQ
ncbi:MAG: DUF2807 domain-containing protein [Bacteroidetes bacterium]|nr:DUF2807 domain-containing protein [Bacteroidota bacterium]